MYDRQSKISFFSLAKVQWNYCRNCFLVYLNLFRCCYKQKIVLNILLVCSYQMFIIFVLLKYTKALIFNIFQCFFFALKNFFEGMFPILLYVICTQFIDFLCTANTVNIKIAKYFIYSTHEFSVLDFLLIQFKPHVF